MDTPAAHPHQSESSTDEPLVLTDEQIQELVDGRPLPPEDLHEIGFEIQPAIEVAEWIKRTFINEGALLCNPDHKHLRQADLVVMWTNVEYSDGGMPVVGQAEIVRVSGKPWPKAEKVDHLCMLHGRIPELRIWLYAPAALDCDIWTFCARVEHELYHFAQQLDKDKLPKFDEDGKPVYAMRAHDVSEFVGVGARYGIDACAGRAKDFFEAVSRPPLVRPVTSRGACGSCGKAI